MSNRLSRISRRAHRRILHGIAIGTAAFVAFVGLGSLLGTVWTTPRTWSHGDHVTESRLNTYLRDDMLYLFENQAAAAGFFRGVVLRTHPDANQRTSKVVLQHADTIILNDGTGVSDWTNLIADKTQSGAGGVDTGSIVASSWNGVYAIRKSSDGTRGLMLHRTPYYSFDATQLTVDSTVALRDASSRTKVAQGVKFTVSQPVNVILLNLSKTGTPTGNMWLTLESDSAGSPSGVVLATSHVIDVSKLPTFAAVVGTHFIFTTPYTATATTQYHIVAQGDFTVSGANYVRIAIKNSDVYAGGQIKTFDGASTWTGATSDAYFGALVSTGTFVPTMPSGYDQYSLIGHVFADGSSNLVPFTAYDRVVTPLTTQTLVSGATATTASVNYLTLDAEGGVPPSVRVKLWANINNNACSGGCLSAIGPIYEGFGISGTGAREAGAAVMSTSASARQSVGPVETDYGVLYYYQSTGTMTMVMDSWEW